MAVLPATANCDKAGQNESKTNRNKACNHLKELVDDVREAGKYLFWRNPNWYRGYVSQYWQKLNRNSKKEDEVIE